MSVQAKLVVQDDPAGLDKLLLAAAKAITLSWETLVAARTGKPLSLWDGKDGVGAVMEEYLQARGVPNKRLSELLTPRLVLQNAGVAPKRRNVRRLKAT
jgi:hypothetical protein